MPIPVAPMSEAKGAHGFVAAMRASTERRGAPPTDLLR
jgi:hypothetical protein